MDERQTQIREGAGLEESRVNQEFVDFLRKWSTPVLAVIAIVVGGWAGLGYLDRQREAAVDEAFLQFESARAAGSPDGLLAVAREHGDRASVGRYARLAAADVLLASYRTGVAPGAQFDADGSLTSEDDLLSDEQRDSNLAQAEELYREVYERSSDNSHAVFAVGGLMGLAAVDESRGDFDAARERYAQVATLAEAAGFVGVKARADELVGDMDALAQLPTLVDGSGLPDVPLGTDINRNILDQLLPQQPDTPALELDPDLSDLPLELLDDPEEEEGDGGDEDGGDG